MKSSITRLFSMSSPYFLFFERCCFSLPLDLRASRKLTCEPSTSHVWEFDFHSDFESIRLFPFAFSEFNHHPDLINMPFAEDAQHHPQFNITSWRTRLGLGPINVSGTSSWPAKLQFETLQDSNQALVDIPGETEKGQPGRSR
jgi:hypothetical protein